MLQLRSSLNTTHLIVQKCIAVCKRTQRNVSMAPKSAPVSRAVSSACTFQARVAVHQTRELVGASHPPFSFRLPCFPHVSTYITTQSAWCSVSVGSTSVLLRAAARA